MRLIPNWSQLRKTPINFLPSRKTSTSFSTGRVTAASANHLRVLPAVWPDVLSVKSSSCAAVVNICGGSCGGPDVGPWLAGPRAFCCCWDCEGEERCCAFGGLSFRDSRSILVGWKVVVGWRKEGESAPESAWEGGGIEGILFRSGFVQDGILMLEQLLQGDREGKCSRRYEFSVPLKIQGSCLSCLRVIYNLHPPLDRDYLHTQLISISTLGSLRMSLLWAKSSPVILPN